MTDPSSIVKFAARGEPGDAEKAFFRENGYLYIENFYDRTREIMPIQRDIFELISLLQEQYGVTSGPRVFTPETFDENLPTLLKEHRPLVGILYDAVKKLPNYVRVAVSPRNDAYARALLDSEFVGFANRGYGIRMDNPGEDEYSTQCHQDYVSQLCSQNGVVMWSPLRDTTKELGPVALYPSSHRSGIFPIMRTEDGSRGLVIDDLAEVLGRFSRMAPEVRVGDCVVMHALLLHESTPNRSSRTRWSMISRYFDFTDASGQRINWRGGLQEGNSFDKIYPELTRIESRNGR